jgi:phage I-like protein
MSSKNMKRVAAQRLDTAYNFTLAPVAEAAVEAAGSDTVLMPFLPAQGSIGRDGRGPFTYDLDVVMANIRANAQDIPVFLDHQPGKAYGWQSYTADPVENADGTYSLPAKMTGDGLLHLRTQAYRYNSPTWLFIQDPAITDRQAGRIVGLVENSLVNLPNQYFRSLNAAEQGAYTALIPSETEPNPMTPEQLALLGLAEGATPEQITTALNALRASANKAEAIITAAGAAADADAPAVVEAAANSRVTAGTLVTKQAYDAVVTARDEAVTSLNTLRADVAKQAVTDAVTAASEQGRCTPAEREDLIDYGTSQGVEKLKAMLAKRPVHKAAQGMQTPADTGAEAADPAADYATTALGITPETFKAGKAA